MDEENLPEEIEELIRERVEEEVEKRMEEKEEIEEQEKQEIDDEMDRRSFLKKLGAGAAGLGALSMLPSASAINVRTDGFSFYGGSGSGLDFDVDNSGNVTIYGDLTAKDGETIWDESNTHIPEERVEQGSGSGLDADTVDGKEASEISGDRIRRNDTGNVYAVNKSVLSSAVTISPPTYKANTDGGGVTNAGSSFSDVVTTTINSINGTYAKIAGDMEPGLDPGGSGTVELDLYRNGNTILEYTDYSVQSASATTNTNITNDNVTARAYLHLTDDNGGTNFVADVTVTVTGYTKTGTRTVTMSNNSSLDPAFLAWTFYTPTHGNWNSPNKALKNGSTIDQNGWFTTTLQSNQSFTLQSISYSNVTTTTTFTAKWSLKEGTYI